MELLLIVGLCFQLFATDKTEACSVTFKNIVVEEGKLDTLIDIPKAAKVAQMTIISTMDELTEEIVLRSDGTVHPSLTDDYEMGLTGLKIRKGTSKVENGRRRTTAGLYTVTCLDFPESVGFKLIVVREGPICSRKELSSDIHEIKCSIVFADSIYYPIHPTMTWSRGNTYHATETPERTNLDPYAYISESTITVYDKTPAIYRCDVEFGETTQRQNLKVATNAPDFKAFCIAR